MSDNVENHESGEDSQSLLKKELKAIEKELKELKLTLVPAALAIGYAYGTISNLKKSKQPIKPSMIRDLKQYIQIQKSILAYFRSNNRDKTLLPYPQGEAATTHALAEEVKTLGSHIRGFIDHQIKKEAQGDKDLENALHSSIYNTGYWNNGPNIRKISRQQQAKIDAILSKQKDTDPEADSEAN